jgi:hypothetical protein
MSAMLINAFLQTLMLVLDGPTIRRGLDALLDVVEEAAIKSDNKMDDKIVLTLTAKIRQELDIPDND